MFCPKGPSATATNGNPAIISLSGLNRDNCVLRLGISGGVAAEVTFSGHSSFLVYGNTESHFRAPSDSSSVTISVSSSNGQANGIMGESI